MLNFTPEQLQLTLVLIAVTIAITATITFKLGKKVGMNEQNSSDAFAEHLGIADLRLRFNRTTIRQAPKKHTITIGRFRYLSDNYPWLLGDVDKAPPEPPSFEYKQD